MSYTPVELRHVKVGRSLFGYNRATVEQVIEEVAQSFEATWRERSELADKVHTLEKQLDELKRREELLTHTLVAAEQAASDVRERARREAEAIVTEAHHEARAISRTAQGERERLVSESRRIEAMLRAALAMIEERVPVEPPKAVAPTPEPAPEAPAVPAVVPVSLPPRIEEAPPLDPAPELWQREDTREFEPIALAEAQVEVEELELPEPESLTGNGRANIAAAPALQPQQGSASRDFDWGE